MDNNWAVENLQVIRTLMERSALYRRALAPIMLGNGILGASAGMVGFFAKVDQPRSFVLFWAVVGFAALAMSFLLARRQAIKDEEPFWSAPTRHVSQALNPPLFAGAAAGLIVLLGAGGRSTSWVSTAPALLPAFWMILYGCSLTAAAFFMRRGIRVVGWLFILTGTLLAGLFLSGSETWRPVLGNLLMGATFGLLHVACGVYLYFTENHRETE